MNPEVYLVTGGSGFIGSHLVNRLVVDGYRVRVLDNLSTGRLSNLDAVISEVEFLKGDIRNPGVCREACREARVVFHHAALPSVTRSLSDPLTTDAVNVTGTLNMLEASRQAGVERFIFASSSSVYGDTPTLPKIETMPENPRSPYAVSKLAGEKYAIVYHVCHQLTTVCLRYFNVFGPNQYPDSPYAAVVPRFIAALKKGQAPIVFGDGEQTRDFTFVEDVVQANLKAMTAEEAGGEVINIGGGRRYSINKLLSLLIELTGADVTPHYNDERPGDIRDSQSDIGKASKILGYRPIFSFREGMNRTLGLNHP